MKMGDTTTQHPRRGIWNKSVMAFLLLLLPLLTMTPASAEEETKDTISPNEEVLTIDDLVRVEIEMGVFDFEIDGRTVQMEGTREVYHRAATNNGQRSSQCSTTYTVSNPYLGGYAPNKYAVGVGQVSQDVACQYSVAATLILQRDTGQNHWRTEATDAEIVSPGETQPFFATKSCANQLYTTAWRGFFNGAGSYGNSNLACNP